MKFDSVIIGGGLAGMACGIRLSEAGQRCAIISQGQSAIHFSSGSFDLLGHMPDGEQVLDPLEGIARLADMAPTHPYSVIGTENCARLAGEVPALLRSAGIEVVGDCHRNHFRITPMGKAKPTWLTIDGYLTSESDDRLPFKTACIVNVEGFLDFYPEFIAEEFAKHIAYGIDIGSGQTFKLSAYYGMCDLVVDALRTRPALLEKHWAICGDECYHDDSLHLLAFDVIYCSRAYNFYQGIYYIPKSESTSAYNKEQLRLKEEAKVQERIDSLETQIQAKDIELDKFRSISLLNVRVTHKQYGTGIVIAQKENTIKVRFPEGLEKSFIIHTKFPARPTFEDDEQVVDAFTEYDRLTREIQGLKKLLEIEKAKVQTTIL